jgi:hypothetical protein
MDASSDEPSECGFTCPQPITMPEESIAKTKRRQSNDKGLILTWEIIFRMVLASTRVAGRSEKLSGEIFRFTIGYFCPLLWFRQGGQNSLPRSAILDKTSV